MNKLLSPPIVIASAILAGLTFINMRNESASANRLVTGMKTNTPRAASGPVSMYRTDKGTVVHGPAVIRRFG